MRSLIIAVCVLIIITAFTIFSTVHIRNFTADLLSIAESLPSIGNDTFGEVKERFSREWEKHRGFLRYTVGHEETEEIDDALCDLTVRFYSHDEPGYLAAKEKLCSLLEEILASEKLAAFAVF